MPYFIIDKLPVHLTASNDVVIRRELYGEDNLTISYIKGYDDKFNQKTVGLLKQKYREDRGKFIEDWVRFDLQDSEAKEGVFDLLYDYCAFRRCGFLSKNQNDDYELDILKDYDEFIYPLGLQYYLNLFAPPTKLLNRILNKKSVSSRILIDVNHIIRVKGELRGFVVETDKEFLKCGEIFEVVLKK
ncbi:hypothetical protein [Saccharibacillus deserti]|uniref:hypothetical protein n=1 Tax=Saccharibacillus deserti TaxID=1634444 RepID=UPI001553450F|nr:hypothetical protein [Saccharibacillus deserti]